MKSTAIALFCGVILASPAALPQAAAQDLPPEVLLLARVKRHMQEELDRLSNVSCLETVFREYQPINGRMKPLDTVQLEVLTDGRKELYASPGDRQFSENPPIAWAGSGVLGNGFFGLYLATVFRSPNISYAWRGYEQVAGRRLARWDYRLPLMWSGQTFVLQDGSGRVSLQGSFLADPESADVARLDVAAGDFPPTLPLSEARWSIEYAPSAVAGDVVLLLPQTADFRMVELSGAASHNAFAFTQCHVFGAQSTLSFNAPDAPAEPARFAASDVDDTLRPLPKGLAVRVKLRTRIRDGMAVGALVAGEVSKNVTLGGKVVLPAGSPVRGRIRRLERYTADPNGGPQPYFVVAIEYTEVAVEGIRYRFDASLSRIGTAAGVEETLSVPAGVDRGIGSQNLGGIAGRETIHFSNLPGVATFFYTGARLNLAEGFETEWVTGRKPGR